MRRHLTRMILALALGTLPMALGLIMAFTMTPAGRDLLARTLAAQLGGLLRGRFEVGAVNGSFLHSLEFEHLTVWDTSGALLADLPHAEVTYQLPNLLAGRIILNSLRIRQPTIHIIKHRNGRLNFQEVLRLGESPPGGSSPLIELRNVQMVDGSLRITQPWNPPDTVTTAEGRRAALAADRAKPGRIIEDGPEGLSKVLTFDDLTLGMSRVRISTPDRRPLTIDIDTLATRLNDPAITITDLVAHAWTRGDSLAFTIRQGAFPATEFYGGGVITWPKGPMLYDFNLEVPRLSLVDVRWVSPDFPALTGHTLFAARSASEKRTAYVMRELHLEQGETRIDGQLTAITDYRRGLGFEDMNLELVKLDLDAVRPYLDTLPLHGTLTGSLAGGGFFNDMNLDLRWTFEDAALPERPLTQLSAAGHVALSGPRGFVFDSFALRESDIDLQTVRRIVPAVALDGRLNAAGTLDGPWRDVTFSGTAEHHDGDRPASRIEGVVHLDTRSDTLRLATDIRLAPLVFDGIRRSFPALTAQGSLQGTLVSSGTLGDLQIDADLRGEIGAYRAAGRVTLQPPKWGADSLVVRMAGVDLAAVRGRGPHTSLTGRVQVSGVVDSAAPPQGELQLELARSRIREVTLDTLFAQAALHHQIVRLDTMLVGVPAGRADGAGTLGWRSPAGGTMTWSLESDSLIAFDSLLFAVSGMARDTSDQARPLDGRARGTVALSGALDSLRADVVFSARKFTWQRIRSPELFATLSWVGGSRPQTEASIQSDSIEVGGWTLIDVDAGVAGYSDSLGWSGRVGLGNSTQILGGGWWSKADTLQRVVFDSLSADIPTHPWKLRRPVRLTLADSSLGLTPVHLEAVDGSGSIQVEGRLPRAGPGDLTISVLGLEFKDVYRLLQKDTTGISGTVGMDLTIGGTGASPTIRGTASLADANFGELGTPFVQAVVNYADRRLETNLSLWKTGQKVLRGEAVLPLDLAFHKVPKRQVPGPLVVRARADSTDLGVLEAFTPTVRRVRGILNADAEVTGSWDDPRLTGFVQILEGAASLPALGVRWTHINGRAHLAGDSIAVDSLILGSGPGELRVTGGLRLERLTRPILGLQLQARRFRAIDQRSFLSLTSSGRLSLTGPVFQAVLTGRITADEGDLHFADLVTKRIVDLENPADPGLIDLGLIREQRLGSSFENRFLDSLAVDNLRLDMGESFWLRSGEANIQLDGTVVINKTRGQYRFDGTLNALRGNYTLKIGFVTRDFLVERGTVRYFGTPDLNAALDIQASHLVHPVDGGDEIKVIAKITGTLLAPKLSLESTTRPPLSETELVSYLMFGRPTFSLSTAGSTQGGLDQAAAFQAGLSYLSAALSSEIQRTLITDLGVPIDYIDIRPGEVSTRNPATAATATQVAQVAAGWQIGRKWFVTLNADICSNLTRFYPNVEFRLSRQFRLQSSIEPTQSCARTPVNVQTDKYQVGFDVLWEFEY